MTETVVHDRLNDLLVNLGRSLLQYTLEAGPWTVELDVCELRPVVERLATNQRHSVQRLAEFLDAAGAPVDFGIYPDEYTSLHYVSLNYLLQQLLAAQQSLVAECEQAARELAHDEEALALVQEILAGGQSAPAGLSAALQRATQ